MKRVARNNIAPPGKRAKRNVRTNTKPNLSHEKFIFDFRDNRWLTGIKVGEFTNKLKDIGLYSKFITEIIGKIIPEIQEKYDDIVSHRVRGYHCHSIDQGDPAYKTILKITREIYGESFERSIDPQEQLYQLGVTGSIRIITLRNRQNNVIRPLFIDYHHLAYPNVKYNQTDYIKQEFCPRSRYL